MCGLLRSPYRAREGLVSRKQKRRNKKKKRHAKPHSAASSGVLFDQLLRDMREMIQQRRVRRAFALAGRVVAHPDFSPSHIEAVVGVYEKRFYEMLTAGHAKKAAQMITAAVAQHPAWRPAFTTATLAHAEIAGGAPALLLSYPNDVSAATTIDSLLRDTIRDLRPLARHPELPDEHPLKVAAAAVIDAWGEIEQDGHRGTAYEHMTATLNRRSPLIAWRLFVQALAAFYEGDDDTAHQCLQRCAACGNVRPMAALLSSLIAGTPPQSDTGRRILRATAGPSLAANLCVIDQYLDRQDFSAAGTTLRRLLRDPALLNRPSLRTDIGALFITRSLEGDNEPSSSILRPLDTGTLLEDAFLRSDLMEDEDEIEEWRNYLKRHRRLAPIDRALICNRMAHLAAQSDPVHDFDKMFSGLFDDFMDDGSMPDDPVNYLRDSVAHCPLPVTFRLWHDYISARSNRQAAEKVLEEWHGHFPEDETPLLLLVDSCRARNVYQKAMSFFRKVDALGKGRPEVEAIRHYLIVDNACRHFAKGRIPKACDLLDTIPDSAEPFVLAIRATLHWIAAWGDPAREGHAEQEMIDLHQPLSILCLRHLLPERKIRFPTTTLPCRLQAQTKDADLVVRNLHYLVTVSDPIWHPAIVASAQPQLPDAIRQTTVESRVLRDCLTGLVDFRGAIREVCLAPLWALTSVGIARHDTHISTFLCYRAFLIRTADRATPSYVEAADSLYGRRILKCLAAAHLTASEHGSIEDVRLVDLIAEKIGDLSCAKRATSLTPLTINKIVKQEAKTHHPTDLPYAPRQRKSRSK